MLIDVHSLLVVALHWLGLVACLVVHIVCAVAVWRSLALPFLVAFAKLRKAAVSLRMSVRLYVRMEIGSNWTDFHEIWYSGIFRKIK